jgi:hypothetical protein
MDLDTTDSLPWWWRQYTPLKRRSTSTRLHDAIYQKAVTFILAAVRTSNLACFVLKEFEAVFALDPNSIEQRPSWKLDSRSASQEIPCPLWNPNVHYHVRKIPPPVPIPSQKNLIHIPQLFLGLPCVLVASGSLRANFYTHFVLHAPPISSFDLIIIIPSEEHKILSSSSLLSLHPSYVKIFFSVSSSHEPQSLCSPLDVSAPSFTRTQNNTITVL